MFEAVTTAAWFGGAGAVLLELVARRAPMRNLFFLGSAVASMTALMAADFLPLSLTPAIGNMMPILHDVWLYIHTNVIIFSYVLIAMAAVTAIMYLLYRLGGGSPDFARAGGAGALLSMNDAAASTDAGSTAKKVTAGEVFDGATMVLLELAFILLWAGVIMGAIWADHSWGRPWGWDPKEVFALNTFIIFVVLVHVRLKVKDKGLWTAWLAVLGCAVMIFNWTVINFVISGLHSYA
jgi:cytochrome c-type biogenesis protein CcsB